MTVSPDARALAAAVPVSDPPCPALGAQAGRLPSLVVAGAPKCGTSSLFAWLAAHPDIAGSRTKETAYFVDPDFFQFDAGANIATTGLAPYAALFAGKPGARHAVEATPSYLYSRAALARLPDLETKPVFVFLLREPARQIYSVYEYFRNNYMLVDRTLGFGDFVERAEAGELADSPNELLRRPLDGARYVDWLDAWRAACGPERMRVYLFEDMAREPRAFMRRLAGRIGVDPAFYDGYAFETANATYHVRSRLVHRLNVALRARVPAGPARNGLRRAYRALNTRAPAGRPVGDAAAMARLRERFAPANAALAERFGLDLSPWRQEV